MHEEISNADLENEKQFKDVAIELQDLFEQNLEDKDTGGLVAHNTCTDIQSLFCEYIRAGIELPKNIKSGLDTITTLRRFSSLAYRKADPFQWIEFTKTGNMSMGVKPCATYALG